MTFSEYLMDTFGINEPIAIEDIRYEKYSRQWIYKKIKELVDNSELKRFDRGIYYFPQKMPWGEAAFDPYKIVYPRFITDGNDVYGYVAGLSLWNESGLSTQVPNLLEIATNNETTRVRDIYVGWQRVRARRSRAKITKENEKTLQFLDLMAIMQPPKEMDETERFMLDKFSMKAKEAGVTKESLMLYSQVFPARATKNMIESGVIYDFAY